MIKHTSSMTPKFNFQPILCCISLLKYTIYIVHKNIQALTQSWSGASLSLSFHQSHFPFVKVWKQHLTYVWPQLSKYLLKHVLSLWNQRALRNNSLFWRRMGGEKAIGWIRRVSPSEVFNSTSPGFCLDSPWRHTASLCRRRQRSLPAQPRVHAPLQTLQR